MSDDERLRNAVAFGARMRATKCSTEGHEDRHAGWLKPRENGMGDRWVCDECHYEVNG